MKANSLCYPMVVFFSLYTVTLRCLNRVRCGAVGKKILFWALEDLDSCVLLISWLCFCLGLSFLIFKEDHDIWSHHFMANRWGSNGNSDRFFFFFGSKSLKMVTIAMKLKDASSLEEKL